MDARPRRHALQSEIELHGLRLAFYGPGYGNSGNVVAIAMARSFGRLLFALMLLAFCAGAARAGEFKACASVPPACDTKGGGWTKSQFPHARVDGCDYIENVFEGLSGQLLGLLSLPDLSPACDVHDRCYYSNAGEDAETCNRRFYEAMLEVCAKTFGGSGPVNVARNRICTTWVAEIAEAVHSVAYGEANLPRARKSQEDYMSFIAETCELKTWDPYPCPQPAPAECRREGDDLCCRNKCVPSCAKGESRWEWQCSR
jgi:hypothetical protein